MSLQVCHCGWSKVTTYHGLRTHQGKMGCTPKGVKVEESEQLYTWGNLGFTMDLVQDAYSSIKTDTTDYYSDLSLQVCHCGWSKMTTYQGLRTHQGKMGCTPKGMRIQEREQYDWKNQYEEVDQRKYQPPKRTIVKKEHVPSPPSRPLLPSTKVRTNSTAATIKEEYKSHIATSQHSLQTATKSHRQLQDFSTGVQARRHPTQTYPETVVRPKVKDRKDQKLSQMADSRVMAGNWSIGSRINFATTTVTVKEEPQSPSAILHSQRTSNPKSGRQPQELSTGVQVKTSVREYPIIPPHATVAQPKKKDRKNQTASQTRERAEAELQKKIQLREEKMSEIREWTERTCESVPDSTSTNTQANSAAAKTKKKEDPKSLHEAARPDFSTGMKVKRLNMECPTTYPATVVQTKEKHREERTLLQNVPVLPSINSEKVVKIKEEPKSPFATPQHSLQRATNSKASHRLQEFCTGVQMNRSSDTGTTTPPLATEVQPKENDRKDQISQNFPDSTSSTTQMNPASAEATTEEDPHSLCKTAQPSDFSTGLKVKELAQIISAITTQKRAARLKEKEREKIKKMETQVDKLVEPVENLDERACLEHGRPLELYSRKKERCICVLCMDDSQEEVVATEDEWDNKKAKLENTKTELQQKIKKRKTQVDEVNASLKICTDEMDAEWWDIEAVFSAVITIVEKAQAEALQPLKDRRRVVEKDAKDRIEKLEAEINTLEKTISDLDKISVLEDHILFLQSYPSLQDVNSIKDWTEVEFDTSLVFGTIRKNTTTLLEQIQQELEKLTSIELKRVPKFTVDVKLDPNTAHQRLLLSDDGKEVKDGGENKEVDDSSERFDLFASILGLNKLTSGKSYWEVEVSSKTGWDLGVARGDANRKGKLH